MLGGVSVIWKDDGRAEEGENELERDVPPLQLAWIISTMVMKKNMGKVMMIW